jgi:hypothetical protein
MSVAANTSCYALYVIDDILTHIYINSLCHVPEDGKHQNM